MVHVTVVDAYCIGIIISVYNSCSDGHDLIFLLACMILFYSAKTVICIYT